MTGLLDLSDLQRDALREVANIGAGHAATALSQMLNTTVRIGAPTIEILKFENLADRLGYGDTPVAAVHMSVLGDAPGQMLVIFNRSQALGFADAFLKRIVGNIQLFDSIVDSTLREIGNIIGGAYLTALMTLTGTNLLPSVPTLSTGTVGATVAKLTSISGDSDVFFIETGFNENDAVVAGQFILIPGDGSLQPLFAAFGLD